MGRIPRGLLVGEGTTNHCTWLGHNASFVLEEPAAKQKFLDLLAEHKDEHGIEIHSYCLMDSHPHVQLRATRGQRAFSRFWKIVNQRFARWRNKMKGSRGQVVMERLRSPRVQDGGHQLNVMRYGDLNPVRAGLVRSPGRWQWSSFRHYAFGEANALLTAPPEYGALGRTAAERRKAYLHLFAQRLGSEVPDAREALVIGPFVGDESWRMARLQELTTTLRKGPSG